MVKIAVTAVASLLVGFVLFQLQRGGRRRRLRVEIREELELLKLVDEGTEPHKRIRAHVDGLLEKYAAEPQERVAEAPGTAWAPLAAVIALVGAVLWSALPDTSWVAVVSVVAAITGSFGAAFLERRNAKWQKSRGLRR